MGWFGEDLFSAISRQFNRDKERKEKEIAKAQANPEIASRISAYRQRHPHLTPGVVLSAAKAGLPANDPAIDRLAEAEARRKVNKNKGWFNIGDIPRALSPLNVIGSSWDDVEKAAKTGIRWGLTALQSGPEGAQEAARRVAKEGVSAFINPGLISDPLGIGDTRATGTFGLPERDFSQSPTTFAVAMQRSRDPEFARQTDEMFIPPGEDMEGGAGIGDGYLPRGPAVEEQKRRARESYFIEYADHPLWHQPGDKRIVEQHAGTFGRLLLKDIIQPGSRPYWFLSGVLDAGFTIVTDPAAVIGKASTVVRQSRRSFSAADAGLDASKKAVGLIDGVRPAIHPPTTQNWLTLSAPGRKFTDWAVENDDPYTIWKTLGGPKGNITPDLATRIADTRSTDDVLDVLGNELGIGLRTKPVTSSIQPVGGYLGEVKRSVYENRIFNQMPHNAVRLDDGEAIVTELVRLGRAGELPEEQIGFLFNAAARAVDNVDRVNVLQEAEVRIAQHISDKLHGPLGGSERNFRNLRGVFQRNNDAMMQVVRQQIANKTGVKATRIDGDDIPLRTVHEEAEYLDQIYHLPDPREMRRMLTTYGRLLNHPTLSVPISALDHIQNVWRGAAILRPALLLRTVGEEQAWMAGSGYDSIFSHPFSAIAWATARKGAVPDLFDPADELSSFSKAMSKNEEWRNRIIGSRKRVVPFTDPDFVKAWSNDIWRLNQDEVASRLARGESLDSVKAWARSDEAADYRRLNHILDDTVDGEVENISNWLKGKTYGDKGLLEAIGSGTYKGKPVLQATDQGHRTLDPTFREYLKKLVDKDISPDHTIGDLPKPRLHPREYYNHFTDKAFDTLLTRPSNYLSRSVVFKQDYWKKVQEAIYHAAPDTQARMIDLAEQANMGKSYIKSLREAAKTSGNLTFDEFDLWAKAQALNTTKKILTDLSDKNQFLDAMRLTIVFGEAWKQSLTTWAKVIAENPAVIPRAAAVVRGGFGSGFFYTDEQTGEEMFAYPGMSFLTGKLTESITGVNMPSPVHARISSLTLFGENPLIPSFGPVAQLAAGKILPDTPSNDDLRKVFVPYGPSRLLPGWVDKLVTAAFSDPEKNVMFGNMVWDVARYLHSTGEYDINTYAGQQALEDKARSAARFLLAFRGAAQALLPAAPSYQDIAKDVDGHTTLAFVLTKRYQELLEEDRTHRTQEATGRFITEFGMNNLLYMQSASQGGDVFTKSGLDWIRNNPDIVDRYPEIYGLLAPDDGGLDMKAYMALFERGERKTLPPKEALRLANHRAAKMIVRNAQSLLPDPAKRSGAQRIWLNNLKENLAQKFPGYVPEFQGTDIQARIRELEAAVDDPMLNRLPVTTAIRTYLAARTQVAAIASKAGITGWETAKKTRSQRQWLRQVASGLISEYPQFSQVYNDLFDIELADDE